MSTLYHVLSRENLEHKRAWAAARGGRLQLTRHKPQMDSAGGRLERYLHCLPNLVGGIRFARRHAAAAIRIDLREHARIVRWRGRRADLGALEGGDVYHLIWDEPGLVFQEWLLANADAVARWSADEALLQADFDAHFAAIEAGSIGPETFFYPEMDRAAQRAEAEQLGRHVGLRVPRSAPDAELDSRSRRGAWRLGVMGGDLVKKLFFAGSATLALAARLAAPPPASPLPYRYLEATCPWGGFDEALEALAGRLMAAPVEGPRGPLELRFVSPDRRAMSRADVRFRAGLQSAAPIPGLDTLPPSPAAREATHEGSLVGLAGSWSPLLRDDPADVRELCCRFEGARSAGNRLILQVG